ncbi:glycosyltransferase family 32 protein [Siccirubricoccus deserti]
MVVRLRLMLEGPEAAAEALQAYRPATAEQRAEEALLRGLIAAEAEALDDAAAHYAKGLALNPHHTSLHQEAARTALLRLDLVAARKHLLAVAEQGRSARRRTGRSSNISQSLAGQLLDELALDTVLATHLRELRSLPAAKRLAPVAALVLANPDNTGPAMQLLLANREVGSAAVALPTTKSPFEKVRLPQGHGPSMASGTLCRASGDPFQTGSKDSIPRRICQYWDTADPPADVQVLMASWREHNPNFSIEYFDDRTAHSFLLKHCPLTVAQAFLRCREPAMRSDLFRLVWLAQRGGLYVDADDRCLAPVEGLLSSSGSVLLYVEDFATIGNNLLGAMPGHPVFVRHWRGQWRPFTGVTGILSGSAPALVF